MISLKSLELTNFLSHEHNKVEFKPNERLLIDGKSGVGKSAIVDAILWALYNKGRVQNRSLISRGAKYAKVILELSDGWKIIRNITNKGVHTLDLLKDGKSFTISGTKNIQDFIENEILHSSYSLFINSVCYPQENLDSFVRQTPAKRKDLLLELLKTAQYDEFYEKCKKEIGEIEAKIVVVDQRNAYLNQDLNSNKELAEHYEEHKKQCGVLEEILNQVEKELAEIRTGVGRTKELERLVEACVTANASLDRALLDQMNKAHEIESQLNQLASLDINSLRAKKERYEELTMESNGIISNIRSLNEWQNEFMALMATKPISPPYDDMLAEATRQIASLKERKIVEELCLNCGKTHKCNLLQGEINSQVLIWQNKILEINEQKQLVEKDIQIFQEKVRVMQEKQPAVDNEKLGGVQEEMRQLKPSIDLYHLAENQKTTANFLQGNLTACKEEQAKIVTARGEQIMVMNDYEREIDSIRLKTPSEKIPLLIRSQEEMKSSYMETLQKLTLAEAAKNKIKEISKENAETLKHRKELSKELDSMIQLKEAFGTNGIKAMVLDYAIPQLEDRINGVLGQLSSFRVALNTQKSSVEGDSTIEGLFISIINDQGEEMDFDAYSGGERLKVTISIAEGLAEFQKIDFRLLDEAVIGLDEESSNQFAKIILAFQERFPQLICISHVQQIKDLFEDKIRIVKIGGKSIIQSAP